MPWHDWQFWVVTGAFALAGIYLLRNVIPGLRGRRKRKAQERKATLTVGGKQVEK